MEADEPGIWRLFCLQRQREQRIFAAGEESITIYGDYTNAQKSVDASIEGEYRGASIVGMVYGAQSDYKSRAMYSSISIKLNVIRPRNRAQTAATGIQWTGCAIWLEEA